MIREMLEYFKVSDGCWEFTGRVTPGAAVGGLGAPSRAWRFGLRNVRVDLNAAAVELVASTPSEVSGWSSA